MKSKTLWWLAAAGAAYYLYKKSQDKAAAATQASTVTSPVPVATPGGPNVLMATAPGGAVMQAVSPVPVQSQVQNYHSGDQDLPHGWAPMFGSKSWGGY